MKTNRVYSNKYWEVKPFPESVEEGRSWREGMVGGNGENGFITSGAPYSDTIIYQNINFIMPSDEPRYTPEELLSEFEEARQAVINFDDTWDVHGRKRTCFYCFHPGHLLRMNVNDRNCESYVRWTDYETGEVCVSFEDEDGIWERRTFTSHTDNVTITEIKKSSEDSKIDMVISIDDVSSMKKFGFRDENFMQYKKIVDEAGSYIAQAAHYPSYEGSELKNGGYAGVTYILNIGGTKEKILFENTDEKQNVGDEQNPAVKICGAEYVYLITKTDRTFDMGEFDEFKNSKSYKLVDSLINDCIAAAENYGGSKFSYDDALKKSAEIQKEMFGAVYFSLGNDENISNEDLIERQKSSKVLSSSFVEKAYNHGRYAMTCCAGKTMSRLCGMWSGEWNTKWRGIYTMDANVNIQSSGMNTGNLKEFGIGYVNFVLRQIEDWKDNAKKSYGMENAIQVPVNCDGDRAMMVEYDSNYPFQYWNAGASWMIQPIFEMYQCYGNITVNTDFGDKELLGEILLPLLRMQTNFWKQLCTPEYYTDTEGNACYLKGKKSLKDGEKYLIIPSYSPENHPKGYESTITANAAMDISAARDGLRMNIEVERILKIEGYEDRISEIKNLAKLLPDYKFDESGALCEWSMKGYEENNVHRHISHLYCAWPAYETQHSNTLTDACNQAIENRNTENKGHDDTASHGWVHKALVAARLKNSKSVYETLYTLLNSDIYYTSLMTDHNTNRRADTYCTDTGFGIVGIINEALLYSNTGEIELLPALPMQWKCGEIRGLMARTEAEVSIKWSNGKVEAKIKSFKSQKIIVSCGESEKTIDFKAGEEKKLEFNI